MFNILSYFKSKKQKEYQENYLVGHISEFEDYYFQVISEDNIGSISLSGNKGAGDIAVYSKEGKYPHCHIRFSKSNEHDCCIVLNSPNYFKHQGKDNTLNNKQMKAFVKWCKEQAQKYSDNENISTNWDVMCYIWNKNNPDNKLDLSKISIPDYKSNMTTIQEEDT